MHGSVRVLEVVKEEPRPCSYLANREAMLDHRIMVEVTPSGLEALLERGWRRFGPDYFRPACGACTSCMPTRVPTATFTPSKSQLRAKKKCAGLQARVGPPRFDEERLALYHRWHAEREGSRGWDDAHLTERGYRLQFSFPHPSAREITFTDPTTNRLVGVGLCDETPNAWSAIYFFYEPSLAHLSLGTVNVVLQIELARVRKLSHVYLGYCVEDCASLMYKAAFRPQERLIGLPADDEAPRWELVAPGR